jgi:hypothetical protein
MNSVPESPFPVQAVPVWAFLFGAVGLLVIGCIVVTIVVLLARGRVLAALVSGFAFVVGAMIVGLFLWSGGTTLVVEQQDGVQLSTLVTREMSTTAPTGIDVSSPDNSPSPPTDVSTESESTPVSEVAKLPEWTSQPEATSKGITTLVLSSQRFVTQEEAEEQLTTELVNRAQQYFHDEHPSRGTWMLPADYAVRSAVKQRHVEVISKTFSGGVTVDMKRIHWQVELSPGMRKDLYPIWRNQVVEQRLMQLGGGVGFATFLLLTGMTYFRVDTRTQGAYRGWLRFAALSVATAGTAAACLVA